MELWAGQRGAGDGDESVAGARLEREDCNKELEQGVFREDWGVKGGWGVEEVTWKWI